ncbi:ABC transporter permease [Chelatococcus asaccharovorans]|uniref:Peptide/nickel transport system permease protein n=1 Tax=Chelatococcus asaccharovorans TaxID=28210 RepID=A0A2V3UDA8_9HYPH|nr:ABC transporter permease [Chelatococcus asaccharovorans]MBS7707022.1 ABC transporter permease [Chelatococcus asaccharovorans]PXW63202.1 peptide/nickel transport system permease protein [Chelatococcus asaccharovorans]
MIALIVRRLLGLVLTLALVSLLVFTVMSVLPGDPAAIMLGTSARPDTLAALRQELGLDQPAVLRYLAWLGGMLTGNLGTSITYGVPVAELIAARLLVTLPLAVLSIAMAMVLALPLGIAAGARRDKPVDYGAMAFAQAAMSLPNFWIGLILILVFSTWLGWLPAGGFPGWQAGVTPAFGALVLPALALALPQAGVLARVARTAVVELSGDDFIRAARAKGLPPRLILWRHIVPNTVVPIITIIGLQFTFLIAGAVLVENVFSLPGLGRLAFQAVAQRDIVVLQSVVLLLAALVIVVNFVVDLCYLLLDPRMRDRR